MERLSVHFFLISVHMVSTLPFSVSLGASDPNDFKTSQQTSLEIILLVELT